MKEDKLVGIIITSILVVMLFCVGATIWTHFECCEVESETLDDH